MKIPLLVIGLVLLVVAYFVVRSMQGYSSAAPARGDPSDDSELSPAGEEIYRIGMSPPYDGKVLVYSLLPCPHCRRTLNFLEDNGILHYNVYVDEYHGRRRAELMDVVKTFNPRGSFPTIILPDGKIIVGFREKLLREALLADAQKTS